MEPKEKRKSSVRYAPEMRERVMRMVRERRQLRGRSAIKEIVIFFLFSTCDLLHTRQLKSPLFLIVNIVLETRDAHFAD
jgi:hypothetical protein